MSASNAGRVAVVGASGSGKSSYVKKLLKASPRVVILDVMDEYKAEGFKPCTSIAQLQDEMRKSFNKFRLAYVPPSGNEAQALNRLSHLCLAAQKPFKGERKGSQLTMVIEEMNTCFPVHGGEAKAPAFAEVCSRGRHSYIHVIGVSQGLAEISTRFRRNLTECVILRQQGGNDIAAAANATGATKAQITALRNLQYLVSKQGEISHGKLN